jgi:hypothetical protein
LFESVNGRKEKLDESFEQKLFPPRFGTNALLIRVNTLVFTGPEVHPFWRFP